MPPGSLRRATIRFVPRGHGAPASAGRSPQSVQDEAVLRALFADTGIRRCSRGRGMLCDAVSEREQPALDDAGREGALIEREERAGHSTDLLLVFASVFF